MLTVNVAYSSSLDSKPRFIRVYADINKAAMFIIMEECSQWLRNWLFGSERLVSTKMESEKNWKYCILHDIVKNHC